MALKMLQQMIKESTLAVTGSTPAAAATAAEVPGGSAGSIDSGYRHLVISQQ